MRLNDLLQLFPAKRIKPVDGLAVTADIWEEAHEYHNQSQRFQTILHQGWGIMVGLQVIASDPPDSSVFILPGIAIDPAGQIIVLPQPVAYEISDEMAGQLHIVLSYEESAPRVDRGNTQDGAPRYVHSQFSITARETLPNTPYVELARVNRAQRTDPFTDAENPVLPDLNEIDLRFRREAKAPHEVSIAVCYLGDVAEKTHGLGASYLANTLNHLSQYHVMVKDDVPLAPGVEQNTLIYLVGEGKIKLSSGQINGLSNYLRRANGTLFFECVDAKAKIAFLDSLSSMDIDPDLIGEGHRLLTDPHLFAAPPLGENLEEPPEVLVDEGIILSMANYGRLWHGTASSTPTREQLRAAMEWGHNIIAYAVNRYRQI
jgi:hypothetical protein